VRYPIALAAFIFATVAFQQKSVAIDSVEATSKDAQAIYKAFLDNWRGKERTSINVSKSAESPTSNDFQDYNECLKSSGTAATTWAKSTPIVDLSGTIGHLSYVHLVDPKKWRPKDPADLISKGQSVESAVDAGYSSGLLTLSAISFNSSRSLAAFTYSFVCGELCGNGGTVIFNKVSESWLQRNQSCGGWIS
jgi:hypothetical protein